MPVDRFHRQVTGIVLGTAAQFGFALAGGNALIAHGFVDRLTQDVDVFTDHEGGVEAASGLVEEALVAAGLQAVRVDKTGGLADLFEGMGAGLAEWVITAPDGASTILQLSFFHRYREPVQTEIGPVLDIEDVVGSKICALASRIEPRDYVDTAAVLGRYSISDVIGFATRMDPGLGHRDFAEAGSRLDEWSDAVFAPFGLTAPDIAELRVRFAAWPRR
jgi:hypothetical protein